MKVMLNRAKRLTKRLLPKKPSQAKELTPFGKRIQARNRIFWEDPHPDMHDAVTCRDELLSRDDPLSSWHCCDLWQRRLSNKWNAREFASKFGCQVPELYWHGRDIDSLDIAALPAHYVIRPTVGHSSRGIFVMAERVNLMDGRTYSDKELKKQLTKTSAQDPDVSFLVEEFVTSEDGRYGLPTDYKLLMFDGTVGAVGAIRKTSRNEIKKRYYTETWGQFEEPIIISTTQKVRDDITLPPRCLPDIIADAKRLSQAYEMFVRLDFYATDKGSVFGEFTPMPALGKSFTEFASRYFLDLWDETYPESKRF